jgi:hypothetical protein
LYFLQESSQLASLPSPPQFSLPLLTFPPPLTFLLPLKLKTHMMI